MLIAILEQDINIFWEVEACNSNGCSDTRRVYFTTKGEKTQPSKPTGLNPGSLSKDNPTIISNTTITLNWDNTNMATYYKVNVAKSNGVIVVKSAKTNYSSYTLSNLEKGKKYFWFIYACNDDGCTESDFKWIEVKNDLKVPDKPAHVVA